MKRKQLQLSMYFLLCVLFAPGGYLRAQTLQANYGSPATPLQVANGPATFKIRINGTLSQVCAGPSALTVTLPAGYVFVSNSATIAGGSGTVAQTSVSNNTATLAVSNIPIAPDSTIITYQAYAGCGVIGGTNTTITYSLAGCAGAVSTTGVVNAQNAQLNIIGVTNNSFVGNIGQVYTRQITVSNNGNGSIDTIYLDSKNALGLAVNGTTANSGSITTTKIWTGTDTTYRYRVVGPTVDGHLSSGESVVFTETVRISGCTANTTEFKSWFGPNATECSSISNLSTAGATIDGSIQPNVVVSLVSQPSLKCLPTGPDSGWVVYQLKNTGTVPALMTNIRNYAANSSSHATAGGVAASSAFGAGGNTCASRAMYTDTSAGVYYSYDGGLTWASDTFSVYQWYNSWPAGGGYNNGKPISLSFQYAIPQLGAGDSVQIRFKIHDEIPACCIGDWYQSSYALSAGFSDLCGNNPITSNSVSTGSYSSQRYSMVNSSPLDAVGGQPYNLSFSGFITNASNNNYRTSGDGYVDYEITLPTSLVPSLTDTTHYLTKNALVRNPDQVIWDAGTRKLRLRFLRSNLISSDYIPWTLSVRTTADCAGTGTQATLNAYVKLAACAATEWNAVCNIFADFTVHGCGTIACVGALNYATKVQRTNYGIYSGSNNGLPGGTLNTSQLNLIGTLYGDTVAVTTRTKINGTSSYSNMYVTITKSETDAMHEFVDAIGYVYNNGTLTTTITGIGAGAVSGTNPSTRTLSLSGTGAPVSFIPNDSIVMVTRFRQLVDADRKIDFTTTMYASNSPSATGLPQFNCDGNWSGTIFNYNSAVVVSSFNSVNMTECVASSSENYIAYQMTPATPGSVRHYKFPYEIRQIWDFDSLRVVVPADFEVTNVNLRITGQGTLATTGISALPLLGFNAATNTYYYDISSLSDQFLAAGIPFSEGLNFLVTPSFKAKCKSANYSNLIAQFGLRSQRVANGVWTWHNTGYWLNSVNNSFAPLNITSASPNQTVNTNNVSWEIQVTNPTSIAKTNAWIAEALGINDITINNVQLLSGPGGTVSNTAVVANGIYQLGNIAANQSRYFRINAVSNNCATDSLRIVYDFKCDTYPTDVAEGEAGCRKKYMPLRVTVQTASLQLQKIVEPLSSVNLCDTLTYELEVTNSGLGTAKNLAVSVELPLTGGILYAMDSYGFKYPSTATNYTSLANSNVITTGNVLNFILPSSALDSLPGTQKYRIIFKLKPATCNFTSGELLLFRPTGTNGCNANISGTSVASNKINLNGVPTSLPVFAISSRADSILGCGSGTITTNYKFKLVKISSGSAQTDTASGFRISLPTLWNMNTSVTYTHGTATYVNSPAAGTYDFTIPAGLLVGDSIVFTTALSTPSGSALTCGPSNAIVESGLVRFQTTCAGQPTCSSQQLLNPQNSSTTIFVKRPSYSITAFTASASGTPPNHLVGSFTLVNANTTFAAQPGTLRVYKDVNANGVQDAGDVLIGSQVFTIANQTSQSFNYDITATSSLGNVCPLVATLELACNCSMPTFSLQCASIVLPVKFLKENIKADGCAVTLDWQYEATVTIVTGFAIERSDKSGSKWQHIAMVAESDQSYVDVTPAAGQWLYRVKALNTDNEAVYSKVLTVNTACKGTAVQLYPNPAKEQLNITLQGYSETQVKYVVMDKLGRTVQTGVLNGNSKNVVSLSTLSSGSYHVHIIYGSRTFVEKLDIIR